MVGFNAFKKVTPTGIKILAGISLVSVVAAVGNGFGFFNLAPWVGGLTLSLTGAFLLAESGFSLMKPTSSKIFGTGLSKALHAIAMVIGGATFIVGVAGLANIAVMETIKTAALWAAPAVVVELFN